MRRAALVTGAGRGIGRAVVGALVAAGHDVIVAARDPVAAQRVAGEFAGAARPAVLDVTDEESVLRVRDQCGVIDILVNNAGLLPVEDTDPLTVGLQVVERALAVNTLGAWRVSQSLLPGMIARGWGRVVMVSSGTGAFSHGLHSGAAGYSMSKAALNAVTVLLADATRGTGVLVNAVNPGRVRTRMMPSASSPPEQAAADIVWAATLPDDGPTGMFFRSRCPIDW